MTYLFSKCNHQVECLVRCSGVPHHINHICGADIMEMETPAEMMRRAEGALPAGSPEPPVEPPGPQPAAQRAARRRHHTQNLRCTLLFPWDFPPRGSSDPSL